VAGVGQEPEDASLQNAPVAEPAALEEDAVAEQPPSHDVGAQVSMLPVEDRAKDDAASALIFQSDLTLTALKLGTTHARARLFCLNALAR